MVAPHSNNARATCRGVFQIAIAIWAVVVTPAGSQTVDRYGDPLPQHAIMRMGTIRLRHTSIVTGVAFSPDGKLLASSGWDGIRIWNANTGAIVATARGTVNQGSFAIAFSPRGKRLASVGGNGLVRLWDAAMGQELFKMLGHEGRTYGIAFAPDGITFATAGSDKTVRLWDTATGDQWLKLEVPDRVRDSHAVAFSSDGKLLAAGANKTIHIWNLDKGESLSTIKNAHGGEINSVLFTLDGAELISSGQSEHRVKIINGKRFATSLSQIRRWNPMTGEPTGEFVAKEAGSNGCCIARSADGSTLASVHMDKIRIWNIADGRLRRTIKYVNRFGIRTHGAAISPDGRRLAVLTPHHDVRLYDVESGKQTLGFPAAHTGRVSAIANSPDGKLVATASADGTARIWEVATGQQKAKFDFGDGIPTRVQAVAFAPDGHRLAIGGYDRPGQFGDFQGKVELWDTAAQEPIWKHQADGRVTALAFNSTGSKLAVAAGLGNDVPFDAGKPAVISMWDAETGDSHKAIEGGTDSSQWINLTAVGGSLLAGGEKMTFARWNMATAARERKLIFDGHERSSLSSIAFAMDGKHAVTSGSFGNLLIVWDLQTGERKYKLSLEGSKGSKLAFSPDGRLLASSSIALFNTAERRYDSAIRIWRVADGAELLRIDQGASRAGCISFTADGTKLLTGMNDTTLLVWDVSSAVEKLDQN